MGVFSQFSSSYLSTLRWHIPFRTYRTETIVLLMILEKTRENIVHFKVQAANANKIQNFMLEYLSTCPPPNPTKISVPKVTSSTIFTDYVYLISPRPPPTKTRAVYNVQRCHPENLVKHTHTQSVLPEGVVLNKLHLHRHHLVESPDGL